MDRSKVFAATATTLVVAAGLLLAYYSSQRSVVAESCIKETLIQPVEYDDHTYLLFLQKGQIKTVVHSESCYCRK